MKIRKLVCLGDSIIWGFPYGPRYSWVETASQTLGFPMVNRGVNGDTAEDLLHRFDRDVISQSPSHIFVMAGTNDASINVPLESYQDRVMQIHARAAANSIGMILGLPIPSGDRWLEHTLEKYRCWLKTYAFSNNVLLVDFAPVMLVPGNGINPDYFADEVHPSKEGYRSMARLFIEFCTEQL